MKKYVIDTSVAFKLFTDEEGRDSAIHILKLAKEQNIILLAPILILYEMLNSFVSNGYSTLETKNNIKAFYGNIDSEIITIKTPSLDLLSKSTELANLDTKGQGYISSYDATFHALAVLENAIFITADKKHYQKTKTLIGSVLLLEDF